MKPISRVFDDIKVMSILEAERNAALGSMESSDLSEQRMKSLRYYDGDMSKEMPDEDGLSSAVSTDVQDTVEGILPIVLDVFMSNEDVVVFNPRGENDEAQAQQETDYVNHVFYQKNPGFLTLYTAIKDGLLQKNGFVKWWMEKETKRTRETYKGLDEDAFSALASDDEVKIVDIEKYPCPDPTNPGQQTDCYNVVVERNSEKQHARVAAVPPEEILISRVAHNIQDAPYWAHIQRKPLADVLAMFDDPKLQEKIKAAPSAAMDTDNYEAVNRQTVQDNDPPGEQPNDVNEAMRLIELAEHYIRLPLEKDGVARRYKITTVAKTVLEVDEVPAWPIATGTPIIMPHRVFGRSLADLTMDIQEIKTSLLRATLNNAYHANNQRLEVSETHASENTLDDILNNRVGGIVRTKMPGGLVPIPTQPIGHWVIPTIEYMDGVRDNRTGLSKNSQGLDPDSLAHSRTGAVTRIMDSAEMRIKMIARIFAETLIVDVFRGLHQMLQQYSEKAEVVKLNGGWVSVNPREWAEREHMTVTMPLGGVSKQMLMQFFEKLLAAQQEVIQFQGGGDGPLVSLKNVYNTFKQTVKLAGLKSADPFFMDPGQPNPNRPKPPDPKMVEANAKAQAIQQKTQADAENNKMRLAAENERAQAKQQAEHQRASDKLQHDVLIDKLEFAHDAKMRQLEAQFDMQIEAFKVKMQAALDTVKAQHEAKLNEQQAELQAKQGVDNV